MNRSKYIKKYEVLKFKEYIGDALLSFLVRDILFTINKGRRQSRGIEMDITSNKTLATIGKRLGIKQNKIDLKKSSFLIFGKSK